MSLFALLATHLEEQEEEEEVFDYYYNEKYKKRIDTLIPFQHTHQGKHIYESYLDEHDTGRQCFYENPYRYEPFNQVSQLLIENFDKIKSELLQHLSVESHFMKWPEKICKTGWKVFGFIGFGRMLQENCERCPQTFALVQYIDQHICKVSTCGFSSLEPNTYISPHRGYEGYSDKVVRLHLGIVVPNDPKNEMQCAIRVGNVKKSWKEKEVLIFDDFLMHEAWNYTDTTRIILLMDLYYPHKPYVKEETLLATYNTTELPDTQDANFSAPLSNLLGEIDVKKYSEFMGNVHQVSKDWDAFS